MSKKTEKVEEVKEAEAVKGLGLNALLKSERLGDKLAGVLVMFSKAEEIRGDKDAQTYTNKISKAKANLRSKSTKELSENETVLKIRKNVSSCYSTLKDSLKDKELELTDEMNETYEMLLSFGKKEKYEDLPSELF